MQEEVENKTLTLMVNGTRFTGRMFKAAIAKYMAHRREVKHQKQQKQDAHVIPHGKQTVKQLIGQNQGVSNIEINDPSIREFDCQCQFEIVRKRRRNFVVFRRGGVTKL
ncbi:DUF3801 domain-containing protein, partial [Oscillospiraceae bacterium 44-34]